MFFYVHCAKLLIYLKAMFFGDLNHGGQGKLAAAVPMARHLM